MPRRVCVPILCSFFFLSCCGALAAATHTVEQVVSVDPDSLDRDDGDSIAEDATWNGVGIQTIDDMGSRIGRLETMLGMCAQHHMDTPSAQDHDEPCREAVSAEEHQDHQEGGGGREWGREWGEEEEEEKDKEGEEEEEEDPHVELLSPAEKAGFINTSGTVVTAYFHIPSKHPHASYKRWIVNFMSLQDAMVIFTSHDLVSEIKVLREHASERTLVIPMDLSATRMATSYDDAFWTHQSAMDPEREIHRSHELFWIWNEKAEWLQRAVNINPFGTLFFAWIDIGYFRDETFNDERILRAIPFSLGREQVLMLDVRDLAESSKNYVGGGFIGGYAGGIRKWHRAYYSVLDLNRDQFIGKDQPWMWRTCEVNPGLCMLVGPDLSRDHGDPWFYMAPFLAGRASDSDVFTVYPNASNYGSDDRFRDTIQVLSVWSGGCSMPVLSGVGKVGGAGVRLFCGSDECVESVSAEQPQWKVERLTLESMCGGTRLAGVLKRSEVHAKLAYGEDYGEIVNLVMRVCLMRRMQQSQAASPYSGKHFLFVDALHLDGAAGLLVAAPMVYENGRGLFLQCEGPATDDYTRGACDPLRAFALSGMSSFEADEIVAAVEDVVHDLMEDSSRFGGDWHALVLDLLSQILLFHGAWQVPLEQGEDSSLGSRIVYLCD